MKPSATVAVDGKEDACVFLNIPALRLLYYQDVREDILWIER